MERRRNNRRPERDGVDPLRCGERWDRVANAGIHLHDPVEDGAVGVNVGGAAGTRLIQAPGVGGDRADNRGVQIDLVERPGLGVLGVLGHARAGLNGRDGLGGLLRGRDGRGGGLSRSRGGIPGGGSSRRGGIGRGLGGRGGGGGVLGARLSRGRGGGLGGIGGRLRDGGGARLARGFGGGGRISGRVGGGLGGRSRLLRVVRGRRVGRQGRGRLGGFGGPARGIGSVAGRRSRSGGVTRGGVHRRRVDDRRRGVIVVVAAADQREAGRSNAGLGAGSQHGAARDLSLPQGGPIVQAAHRKVLSGTRLSHVGPLGARARKV